MASSTEHPAHMTIEQPPEKGMPKDQSHVEPEKANKIGRRKRHQNQETLSYRRTPHSTTPSNQPMLCSRLTSNPGIECLAELQGTG
jgi:hypothetical protein